jgi:3-dehydroquinate synthetase
MGCAPRSGLRSSWSAFRPTALELATQPLPYSLGSVTEALGADKKHSGGRLHWVLPTAEGVAIDADVAPDIVERVAAGMLEAGVAA